MEFNQPLVLIRGGGDLASGVALRLHRVGFAVLITEIEKPMTVRRAVAFSQAVYTGEAQVEDVTGRLVEETAEVQTALQEQIIPIVIDPQADIRSKLKPIAIIDARMRKKPPDLALNAEYLLIGLGPGFSAGLDCYAVVETNRGHMMGRVIWDGSAEADTGVPESVRGYDVDRVLRAPTDGELQGGLKIGTRVQKGDQLANVGNAPVLAPFDGVLRGIVHDGLRVRTGMKIGDLDPRGVQEYCFSVSDKALAVGGGVLEALLSFEDIRKALAG
ncbi:MAG: selenium-dependent molybdenum cofactor biosynthesis protein YqeB [Anaerolineales bacterium]|jgi:xanthine dehydrogenase accessory factor